jgi:hypothetical protein
VARSLLERALASHEGAYGRQPPAVPTDLSKLAMVLQDLESRGRHSGWRSPQTPQPGGSGLAPLWPNRVPTGPPEPALASLGKPLGEFKMPACAPLDHPFPGPGNRIGPGG